MSGVYIWQPMFQKYQRESKGTWQYEVVQQTRAEELNRHADAVAEASTKSPANPANPAQTPDAPPSSTPRPASSSATADSKDSKGSTP
ncbi:hypothetical protein BGX31_006181 [Mortierella sp. GBA43]|nr:hypothetical protein BGX31_006181 [Mortierella sp. GBA43]